MDPSYSVLLGDDNNDCAGNSKNGGGVNKMVLYTVIPIVVGLALIIAVSVIAYPRYKILF